MIFKSPDFGWKAVLKSAVVGLTISAFSFIAVIALTGAYASWQMALGLIVSLTLWLVLSVAWYQMAEG